MTQATIRKYHRRLGMALALFILLQAGSGLTLTMADLGPHSMAVHHHDGGPALLAAGWLPALRFLHHGATWWLAGYRLLLAAAIIAQTLFGVTIFLRMRKIAAKGKDAV